MATAKKLTDNHLTCGICTEVFRDPATLQCNHTFCKCCLLKYTKTQTEATQAKSIRCPSCRQMTKVAIPDSPVEEWISQLKPSHVIQGLMDDFGEEARGIDCCMVCKREGEITPATSWCATCSDSFCDRCLKVHRNMSLSSDHEVVDLSKKGQGKCKRHFMCKIHRDKQIELFCKDCTIPICTLCCSINHRKCDDVVTIDSMATLVKEHMTKETMKLKDKMKLKTDNISSAESSIKKITENASSVRCEIQKVRREAVHYLMRKEQLLLDQVDRFEEDNVKNWNRFIQSEEIDLQMYQQQIKITTNAVTSDCDEDMYALYKQADITSTDQIKILKKDVKRPTRHRISFRQNEEIFLTLNNLNLGDVKNRSGIFNFSFLFKR
ncbi:transcription intermediary factor 1-beta-like [Haliotis rufescens]|uniref:transcription intermediary factor 1-beta-like n=1 Tax=Haliotis rufescens TaxID=6454 RepID=UPI00201F22E8|nr:transcription intermediary factor 1-beta-like [Haliotis rufescens]XP_048253802.1 transcription intermediary factor 1-beta-like [Haliotis rufescens]